MEKFGRYLLLERVATGGMAEVYRAMALGTAGFSKQVAIKRIHPHLCDDRWVIQCLIREAKLAAELDHPNIIRVIDLGRVGTSYFLAMDYVAGQPLDRIMTRAAASQRSVPTNLTLYIMQQALRGLVHAHQRRDVHGQPMNIIHRDVSPENLMISYEGMVHLVDFGIARAANHASVTGSGTLVGKPAYFSPEVVLGKPVTQDVDTYAMAVVLHEALTLRRFRRLPEDTTSWREVVTKPSPELDGLHERLPPPLADLLQRALHQDPLCRYRSSEALAAALGDATRQLGPVGTAEDVAVLLASLFPDELKRECAAHAHFSELVRRRPHREDLEPDGTHVVTERPRASPPPLPAKARRPDPWRTRKPFAAALGLAVTALLATQLDLDDNESDSRPAHHEGNDTTPAPEHHESVAAANVVKEPLPVRAAEPDPLLVTATPPRLLPAPVDLAGAGRRGRGRLNLQSHPWARVYVDGRDTGRFTPLIGLELDAGRHQIQLVNDETGGSDTFTVRIRADVELTEARELH
ncbi:MAG: serine/threonine-protein kinase [Myxococcota bacterium]